MRNKWRNYLLIAFTFIVAAILTIFPLPNSLVYLRPQWFMLTLIYWVVFLPNFLGVITGFIIGLFVDFLLNTLLGSMGLTLALVTFLANVFKSKLKHFHMQQHLLIIFIILCIAQLVRLWIHSLMGYPSLSIIYWVSVLISVIIWPLVFVALKSYQRNLL